MNTREVIRMYTKARYVGINRRQKPLVRAPIKEVELDVPLPNEAKVPGISTDATSSAESTPEQI